MLSYHQSSDCYHTILRILCILSELSPRVELDKLYILDFYYAFPNYVKNIRATSQDTTAKKEISKKFALYSSETDPQRIFIEVNPIQKFAVNALLNSGFVTKDDDKLSLNHAQIPKMIHESINTKKANDRELLSFLTKNLNSFGTLGKNGLKDRTQLMEYRYDDV